MGSSTYLTDNFGRPSHYYETLPFGEMIVEHNQSAANGVGYDNKWKFNGKEFDDATGMYYYGARYYDPRISIFVSVDPLAEKTMEPYLYTGNNPIMFTDPTGMSKDDIFEIATDGKITQIEAEGEDVIMMVDKKGNRTGEQYKIGYDAQLLNGNGKLQVLIINDKEKGHEAFKKIAQHVYNEYGKIEYNDNTSKTEKTALLTIRERGEVPATTFAKQIEETGVGVVSTIDHSHKNGYPTPSGYDRLSNEIESKHNPTGDAHGAVNYPLNANGEPINRHVYNPSKKGGTAYKYDKDKYEKVENY